MVNNTHDEELDPFQYMSYKRIPKNNILLKIDSEISLSFINDLLAKTYKRTFGQSAWKPEVMVRIGILQKMYNLSDEDVIEEVALNRAYEYFCHLSPLEDPPDPATLCKFRKMRLGKNTMDEILTEIVRQMVEKGIIGKDSGIIIDSAHTHVNPRKKVPDDLKELIAKNILRERAE